MRGNRRNNELLVELSWMLKSPIFVIVFYWDANYTSPTSFMRFYPRAHLLRSRWKAIWIILYWFFIRATTVWRRRQDENREMRCARSLWPLIKLSRRFEKERKEKKVQKQSCWPANIVRDLFIWKKWLRKFSCYLPPFKIPERPTC